GALTDRHLLHRTRSFRFRGCRFFRASSHRSACWLTSPCPAPPPTGEGGRTAGLAAPRAPAPRRIVPGPQPRGCRGACYTRPRRRGTPAAIVPWYGVEAVAKLVPLAGNLIERRVRVLLDELVPRCELYRHYLFPFRRFPPSGYCWPTSSARGACAAGRKAGYQTQAGGPQ